MGEKNRTSNIYILKYKKLDIKCILKYIHKYHFVYILKILKYIRLNKYNKCILKYIHKYYFVYTYI